MASVYGGGDSSPSTAEQLLYAMLDGSQPSTSDEPQYSSPEHGQPSSMDAPPNAPWTSGETKYLLDKYALYTPKVGPLMRFRTKRAMYEQIAREIEEVLGTKRTAIQCETRFKTVAKRKKSEEKVNKTSGQAPCRPTFEEEFSAIRAIDDSLEPEVLRGIGNVHYKNTATHVRSSSHSSQGSAELDTASEGLLAEDLCQSNLEEPDTVSPCKKRKADRSMRPSTSRAKHMDLFFEKMREIVQENEAKKEERRMS
ncbi:uncharacterized protein LOC144102532 [Amblyomma americanum]